MCWDFTSLAHPSSCARVPPPLIWLWVLDAFEKNNAPPPTSATAVPAETQAHVREAREAAGTVDDVAPSGTWRAEAGVAFGAAVTGAVPFAGMAAAATVACDD